MPKIRIQGLVRQMNQTRRQLAEGIERGQESAFRRQVEDTVSQVESICRKHRMKPEQLPAPSYRAYLFLKNIDMKDLPRRSTSSSSAVPVVQVRVANLSKACDVLHEQMSALVKELKYDTTGLTVGSPAMLKLQAAIKRQTARVDRRCKAQGASPADLPVRSRRAYQWLRLLSDSRHLLLHLDTLAMACRIAALPENRKRFPIMRRRQEVRISIFNSSSLYRASQYTHHFDVVIHEGFISAPPEVIEALVQSILLGKTARRSAVIRDYNTSEEFVEISMAMALADGGSSLSSQGRQYNLEEVFKRVNREYFSGQLAQPLLRWNRTLTNRKFGHYQPDSDTVMLSVTLDSPQVPQMVVDFVMYHELLHKALGIRLVGSRHYAHTSEFRAAEKKFRRYEAAQAALNRLASGRSAM